MTGELYLFTTPLIVHEPISCLFPLQKKGASLNTPERRKHVCPSTDPVSPSRSCEWGIPLQLWELSLWIQGQRGGLHLLQVVHQLRWNGEYVQVLLIAQHMFSLFFLCINSLRTCPAHIYILCKTYKL